MKKLVFHSVSFDTFWAHYYVNKDQDFINRLRSLGYEYYQSDEIDLKDADYIIFCEATSIGLHRLSFYNKLKYLAKKVLGRGTNNVHDKYAECKSRGFFNKTALIVAEGVIHLPENHIPKLGKIFNIVFTWNDLMVDGKRFFKYNIPQPIQWPKIEIVPFADKKLLVNISANKTNKSRLELYSARLDSIVFFEKNLGNEFELYGIGWNEPNSNNPNTCKEFFSSYKGTVEHKTSVFPKFKFALCYENASVPGYVTEKVFDCMRSSCVPVYLGAPNICDYLPQNTFIDRRDFSNNEELSVFLQSIDKKKYDGYMKSIASYLDNKFVDFQCTSFADRIIATLETNKL